MVVDIYLVANPTTITNIEGINCLVYTTQVEKKIEPKTTLTVTRLNTLF